MDFFYDYKLHKTNNGYEVILFMRPNSTLEEFAEEFGLTKRSEEDINRIAVGYVKKKFPSLKIKTIKVMIGGALITTIMFGGSMTHALANEDETTTQSETTTETSPDGTTDATSETTTGETTTDGTTETNGDATTETTTEETSPTGETTNESTPNETEGSIPIVLDIFSAKFVNLDPINLELSIEPTSINFSISSLGIVASNDET